MNYAAWGSTWLGSWGESWGPLHEVANTWDTSQGMARYNYLAKRFKFEPIKDAEVRVSTTGDVAGATTRVRVFATGVSKACSAGAATGAASPITRAKANAFVRPKAHGAVVSATGVRSSGGSYCPSHGYSLDHGIGRVRSSASAKVSTRAQGAITESCSAVHVLAVKNPSDEEVGAMIRLVLATRQRNMLTRKQI